MNMRERYPEEKKQKESSSLLGKLLREKRKEKAMTLKDASSKIGLSFQQLWQLEDGVQNASVITLESLSKFYGIPMTTLIKLNFKNSAAYKNYLKQMKEYEGK